MAKFICTVCGYVHEGDAAPEKCPHQKNAMYTLKRVKEITNKDLKFYECDIRDRKGLDEIFAKEKAFERRLFLLY